MTRKYGNSQIEFNNRTYISVETLAERTGYSVFSIRHMARQKQIPSLKFGHRWMFNLQDVMSVLAPQISLETEGTDASAPERTASLLSRI